MDIIKNKKLFKIQNPIVKFNPVLEVQKIELQPSFLKFEQLQKTINILAVEDIENWYLRNNSVSILKHSTNSFLLNIKVLFKINGQLDLVAINQTILLPLD